jgi:hypothetical protein
MLLDVSAAAACEWPLSTMNSMRRAHASPSLILVRARSGRGGTRPSGGGSSKGFCRKKRRRLHRKTLGFPASAQREASSTKPTGPLRMDKFFGGDAEHAADKDARL